MYPPIVVGSEELREEDLSHPVHSDNCMIQDDGSCIADDLAYSQRHYRYDTPTTQHSYIHSCHPRIPSLIRVLAGRTANLLLLFCTNL